MHKFQHPLELGTDPTTEQPKLGFAVKDMFIYDPRLSECGRFEVDPMEAYRIPPEDVVALDALNSAIHAAAETALNSGALEVQHALGVSTGDFAGVYFSGPEKRHQLENMFAENMFAEYMLAEIRAQED